MSAKHWTPVNRSVVGEASQRPELLPGEALLMRQDGVGLYDGPNRSTTFERGVLWATTHRLVFLNSAPANPSAALSLSRISAVSSSGGFSAKMLPASMSSSPKITLSLKQLDQPSNYSAQSILPQTNASPWTCSICNSINVGTVTICNECGVKRESSSSPAAQSPPISTRVSVSEKACPTCTFINHIDVVFCEACDSRFPENATPNILQQINTTTSQTSLAALNEDLTVKISFRAGGIIEFVKVLKGALAAKEWEKTSSAQGTSLEDATKALSVGVTGGGISGIIKKVDHTNQVLDQTLSSSFQDLDALMSKASEMVKLAESINSRLATASSTGGAASSSSLDAPELVAFRSFLVDLGIPSPVTKEMTGDAYTQELAKELSDFLHRVLPRYSGILPLTDLYCLFNRARGVALISPQDLQKSVGLFETLGLPFRVRKFDSGLTVVHSSAFGDDAIATRVVAIVQEQAGMGGWGGGGITALDVAAREGVSIVLAKELLLITEKYGLVCRDDSVEGLRFYDNVMLKC